MVVPRYNVFICRGEEDSAESNSSENPITSNHKYPATTSPNYIGVEEWDTVVKEVDEVMLEEEEKGDTVNKVRILHIF